MKRIILLTIFVLTGYVLPVNAVSLYLNPDITIAVGSSFNVTLGVANLRSGQNVGDFDVDVLFNKNQMSFTKYVLGGYLGNVSNGEALDLSKGEFSPGQIDLAEVSLLSPAELMALQQNKTNFELATLTFTCLALGTSIIEIDTSNPLFTYKVGDVYGDKFDPVNICDYSEVNQVVPEPSTILLVFGGLLGLMGIRKFRNVES